MRADVHNSSLLMALLGAVFRKLRRRSCRCKRSLSQRTIDSVLIALSCLTAQVCLSVKPASISSIKDLFSWPMPVLGQWLGQISHFLVYGAVAKGIRQRYVIDLIMCASWLRALPLFA